MNDWTQPYYTAQDKDTVELMQELLQQSIEKLEKNRVDKICPIYIELAKYITLRGLLCERSIQKGYAKEAIIDDLQDSKYISLSQLHTKSILANHKETNAEENIRVGACKVLSDGFRKLGHLFAAVDENGKNVVYRSPAARFIVFTATRQSLKDREESRITYDTAKKTICNLVIDKSWVSGCETAKKYKHILGSMDYYFKALNKLIDFGYIEKDKNDCTKRMNYKLRRTSKSIKLRKRGSALVITIPSDT